MARMKFLCDADRCIECNACVTACKNENEVPWGINRRRVVTLNDGKPGERSVSMACMSCALSMRSAMPSYRRTRTGRANSSEFRSPATTRTLWISRRVSSERLVSNPSSSGDWRWANIWFPERRSAASIRQMKSGRSQRTSIKRFGMSACARHIRTFERCPVLRTSHLRCTTL